MRFAVRLTRIIALACLAGSLSACGSGNQQPVASASTGSISFSAQSPDAPTPAAQTFTASVSPGTVSVAVLHGGSAIAGATYVLSGNTVQVTVDPASPGTLGAGNFSGTVSVTGYSCGNPSCSQLVSGNSALVNVSYGIPPIVRYVSPYIGVATGSPAAASGTVIIRGRGFDAFPVQNVTFNGTPAPSFSVVSDTEIQASYAGLAAGGPYTVTIVAPGSPGAVFSEAALQVVPVPNYAATTLQYPAGVTGMNQLLYDAGRQALLLAVSTTSGTPEVLRYAYSTGSWQQSSVPVAGLADISLSTQGNELLALSQQALSELDPAALTLLSSYTPNPAPAPGLPANAYFKNLVVANDGNAVVTTGIAGSTVTPVYLFSARSPAFTQPSTAPSLDNATPGASADGSLVTLAEGDPSLASNPPAAYEYTAASESFSATTTLINQNQIAPVLDRSAVHVVLNGTSVYNNAFNYLGSLPGTTLAVALSPDSNCAYTYDSSGQILTFNLNAGASGGSFVSLGGTPVSSPGTAGLVKMVISPDGGTLFLAGSSQIVVAAAPLNLCN